jgi:hypothetical protein
MLLRTSVGSRPFKSGGPSLEESPHFHLSIDD